MKQKTRDIILSLASKNGFTFYAPVAQALNVKGRTAENHLKTLVKEGYLIMRDDGIHAKQFEIPPVPAV